VLSALILFRVLTVLSASREFVANLLRVLTVLSLLNVSSDVEGVELVGFVVDVECCVCVELSLLGAFSVF